MQQLDINTILQIATVLIILISLRWRLPSKDDIKRLDDRIDALNADMKAGFIQQNAKMEARFQQQDAKIDDTRKEMKADLQRLEDRLQAANEYHARSVDLLDAIRRELEDRREPL